MRGENSICLWGQPEAVILCPPPPPGVQLQLLRWVALGTYLDSALAPEM